MKSDLKGPETKKEKNEYPCLKIHLTLGFVVLFSGPGMGTVVHDAKGMYRIGYQFFGYDHAEVWEERHFEPLKGTITLYN